MPQDTPFGVRPPRPTWRLTVVGARNLTPRMREISLIGEDLRAFSHRPGQDLLLNLPSEQGIARRHYTVRRFDPAELRLDIQFVLHGDAPAARWAREARHGDGLIAEGPRGRTTVRGQADWRLFTGDETALPAIAAMIEQLPQGARAFAIVEVDGPEDEQPIRTQADLQIRWLHRGRAPVAPSRTLIEALAEFEAPPGVGQACVIGETATVRAQRQSLLARGMEKDQIAAEGYWRPGRVGGHDHIIERDLGHLASLARGGRERGWQRA